MKYIYLFLLIFISVCVFGHSYKPGYAQYYIKKCDYKEDFEKNNIKTYQLKSNIAVTKSDGGFKKEGSSKFRLKSIELSENKGLKVYTCKEGKQKEVYTYNALNQLVSYFLKDNDGETESISYIYNKKGLMVSLIEKNNKKLMSKYTLVYDKNDRLVEESSRSKSIGFNGKYGFREEKSIMTYDEKNRVIEEIRYDSEKMIRKHLKIKYSENGKRIEVKKKSDYSENLVNQETFVYDDSGNVLEQIYYSYGGVMDKKYTYTYNANNQVLTFSEFNENNKLVSQEFSKYNEQGDAVWIKKKYAFNNRVNESNYEYVYNKNGQWTECILCEIEGTRQKCKLSERTISYTK